MKHRLYLLTALVTAILTLISCASRYAMDLYLISGEKSQKVKVEQTQFAAMTVLASPYAEEKIVQGMGNTLMIGTGSRGARGPKISQYDVLRFDEYLRYRIYIQLPKTLERGSVSLPGNSFAQVLERYDKPQEENIFLAESGNFVLDSVVSRYLFATLQQGVFTNSKGSKVTFDGRCKVRVAD
jgi:hypothetical protein